MIDASKSIETNNYGSFIQNVATLLQLVLIIPVILATAERSFSVLKRLETFLRIKLSESRLYGLTLDVKISCDEVMVLFAKFKPRRLATLNWSFEE